MELNTIEDWEQWSKLAKEDPEKFEKERAAAIEELIMHQLTPESRKRCRRLQWKIDAIRKTSPNSLASCIRIYDLLMESLYGPKGLLKTICRLSDEVRLPDDESILPAKSGLRLEFTKKGASRNGSATH